MTDHFVAIDVETANNERGSICQIGLTAFSQGAVSWEWSSLVNPECDFDGFNVRLHGIASEHVMTAPAWPSVLTAIAASIADQIIVSHTSFDREALHHATQRYGLALPPCSWLDTAVVAKMAWPNLSRHDLKTLCGEFGIPLGHHDAASDARACGQVLARAIVETGLGIADWISRIDAAARSERRGRSSQRRYSERVEADGNPAGPLAGHEWVCTGDFSAGEAALAAAAASLGYDVRERVSKKTTILVVGQRNAAQFGGKEKSRKLLDAEAAIAKGRPIRIMSEAEFLELARSYGIGGIIRARQSATRPDELAEALFDAKLPLEQRSETPEHEIRRGLAL